MNKIYCQKVYCLTFYEDKSRCNFIRFNKLVLRKWNALLHILLFSWIIHGISYIRIYNYVIISRNRQKDQIAYVNMHKYFWPVLHMQVLFGWSSITYSRRKLLAVWWEVYIELLYPTMKENPSTHLYFITFFKKAITISRGKLL